MIGKASKILATALIVSILGACSTNARRVDCSGRLQPINRAAPKALAGGNQAGANAVHAAPKEPAP